MRPQSFDQSRGIGLCGGRRLDERVKLFSKFGIGNAEDGAIQHLGQAQQRCLDFSRIDVHAA